MSQFDHIELAVSDLNQASEILLRLGFEKVGSREILERKLTSHLFAQNQIRILVSHSADSQDVVAKFLKAHGQGVCSIAFRVEDALGAFEQFVQRGSEIAAPPRTYTKEFGTVTQAALKSFGDVQHILITRTGNNFCEGFDLPVKVASQGYLESIEHLTAVVEENEIEKWKKVYPDRDFDIRVDADFLSVNHGGGIQQIAFESTSLLAAVRHFRKEGVKFLETPTTYYEAVPSRVLNVQENLGELEELGIHVDGDKGGYLLQIFTQPTLGPLSYEIIQRHGFTGFGDHRPYTEALERHQARSGVLK